MFFIVFFEVRKQPVSILPANLSFIFHLRQSLLQYFFHGHGAGLQVQCLRLHEAEGQKLVLMPCHGFLNVGIPIGHVYKVELDGKLVGYLPKNKLLKVGFNINQFGISSSNCSCLVCVPDDQVNGDVKKVEIVLIKTQDDLKDLTDRL